MSQQQTTSWFLFCSFFFFFVCVTVQSFSRNILMPTCVSNLFCLFEILQSVVSSSQKSCPICCGHWISSTNLLSSKCFTWLFWKISRQSGELLCSSLSTVVPRCYISCATRHGVLLMVETWLQCENHAGKAGPRAAGNRHAERLHGRVLPEPQPRQHPALVRAAPLQRSQTLLPRQQGQYRPQLELFTSHVEHEKSRTTRNSLPAGCGTDFNIVCSGTLFHIFRPRMWSGWFSAEWCLMAGWVPGGHGEHPWDSGAAAHHRHIPDEDLPHDQVADDRAQVA